MKTKEQKKAETEALRRTASEMFSHYQHYYVRDGNQPVGTIVVGALKETGAICRGISICSTIENFDREEGRNRATARMLSAVKHRKHDLRILTSNERRMADLRVGPQAESVDRFVGAFMKSDGILPTVWKVGYAVRPTVREEKILSVRA
jgi:hypothetical protein